MDMSGCPPSGASKQKEFRRGMGEFGTGSDREGCPWRLARCSAKLAEESTDYYGSITGITGPSPVYAAGQPFPGAGWFLYRLNLDDGSAVAYIEEMIPLRCAFALYTQKTVDSLTRHHTHFSILSFCSRCTGGSAERIHKMDLPWRRSWLRTSPAGVAVAVLAPAMGLGFGWHQRQRARMRGRPRRAGAGPTCRRTWPPWETVTSMRRASLDPRAKTTRRLNRAIATAWRAHATRTRSLAT